MKTFREYSFERDAEGMPTKLIWLGDHPIPEKKSQAERDVERLAAYELVYGKRTQE